MADNGILGTVPFMSQHSSRRIERHCDVAVVGGSAAGLAAALQIVRQGRSVIVVDSGEPRNAPAVHMHGYLGHEGVPPGAFSALGREEVRSYGGEVVPGRVETVTRQDDARFRLELVGGTSVVARRVLAATGLVDLLPEIDGVSELWGTGVIHCPFCHGFEVRDRRVVQIVTHAMGLHSAVLFRQLSAEMTLVLHDGVDAGSPELETLRAGGVPIISGVVRRIVARKDGSVSAVELSDGRHLEAEAVVVTAQFAARVKPFLQLGLATVTHMSGLGNFVEVDMTGQTSIPGVYAAGNVTDPSQQVLQAAADGSRVGAMICFSLAHEDLQAAERPSANQADWDHRYGGERLWSGNPNGTLVHEVAGLTPGRVIDVGAGEGGDAIWLAETGWEVVATDISKQALGIVGEEAQRRGLSIECCRTDANALGAFDTAAFDLVSAQYASIPRTPDDRAAHNLLSAVAPGGTILVVSHDIEPMRAPVDTQQHSRAFDPDAYVRVEDFVRILAGSPDWEVVVHEKRTRPPGSATAAHHVDDIVLRAKRRS